MSESCIAAGCHLPVLTMAYMGSTPFVSRSIMVLNNFQDIFCDLPTLLLSNSQSGFLVLAAPNNFQSICHGLLPSALTHVQSNSGDLLSVTALPYSQSMSQCYSIVLTLTSVQSVQCCIPSLEGSLSNSKYNESMYSPIIKKHALNCYIKLLRVSDSVSQLALCLHQTELSLHEYIFLENPFLVLVVHKLGIYSFMFWKKLLESWKDISPLFCFVLELCHNIIIENQNIMAIWRFWNLTRRNPIFLYGLFFRRHLYSKHDLVAAIRNLFQSIITYQYQYPKYINFSWLMFQPKLKTQR